MNMISSAGITPLAPQTLTICICVCSGIVILFLLFMCFASSSKAVITKQYNLALNAKQRKEIKANDRRKNAQKCIDVTLSLLKSAIIKKTYKTPNFFDLPGYQSKTMYTIPLNRKEALLYIWAKVIARSTEKERDRVVRMAALILGILEENKKKHIIELEAQALRGYDIYGSMYGRQQLEIRAVDNVDYVNKNFFMLGHDDTLIAESVDFQWPSIVIGLAEKLKKLALLAISEEETQNIAVFPCTTCKKLCRISDLEFLMCPDCRKK